jgi:hypothetical protein
MDAAFTRAQMGSASDADWRVIEHNALANGFSAEDVARLRAAVTGNNAPMPGAGDLFSGVTSGQLAQLGVPGTFWNTPGPVPIYPDLAAPLGDGGGRRRGNAGNLGQSGGDPFSGLINWRYSG